ncbi:hypothetical protein BpHYR1_045295 [Brachionus plicatilis]|uniref:Uncharacterized protein n=1 Tax=Brachionus plicatilis TaxID=10195 RepID=A0A3M7SMQ3_BRAPC|nr:hypothetical protein BpHYR1_045295 [Brachionus plicatilis]
MKFIRTELVSDLLSKFRATFFGLLIADINIKFTLKPSEKINIFREREKKADLRFEYFPIINCVFTDYLLFIIRFYNSLSLEDSNKKRYNFKATKNGTKNIQEQNGKCFFIII